MTTSMRGVFRVAAIGAIILAQIAATPKHKPPYNVQWYLHPQRLVDVGGRRLNIICTGTSSADSDPRGGAYRRFDRLAVSATRDFTNDEGLLVRSRRIGL